MKRDIAIVIGKSSEDFLRLVWPRLGTGFGEPIPVETVTDNAFAKELDIRAGIDTWLIGVDGHMRGLASRVQWGIRLNGEMTNGSYDTFSIRVKSRHGRPTEIDKRRAEIAKPGTITPHYVCQAYVSLDRTRLIAAAIARMKDVIAAVDMEIGRIMPANADGSQGWAVPWAALRRAGNDIQIWRSGDA